MDTTGRADLKSGLQLLAQFPFHLVSLALAARVVRSSSSSTDARWHQNAFEEKGSRFQLLSDNTHILIVGILKFRWTELLL